MNIDSSKIAIITTVSNKVLYHKSLKTHPKGVQRIMIDGSNGLYGIDSLLFMFRKLKKTNFEWVIMADEDVFFINQEKTLELIEYMDNKNYTICGVRDGGVVNHRVNNPYAMNTFFLIINYKKLRLTWNEKEVLSTLDVKQKAESKLSHLRYKFDINSRFEPYYCFFFWMINKGYNLLYLEAVSPISKNDLISNKVLNNEGVELLLHTWYARSYGNLIFQTARIDTLVKTLKYFNLDENYIVWKDNFFSIKLFFRKYNKKYFIKLIKKIIRKLYKFITLLEK